MANLINWDKAAELRSDVGAEDFDEVVELFLEEVEEVINQLGNENRSVEHDLHFLKGAALNLGFAQFSDLCRDGEAAAAAGNPQTVDLLEIQASYNASRENFLAEFEVKLAG